MMSTQAGISLSDPNVKAIDMSKPNFKVWEASEDVYQRFVLAQENFLDARYSERPDVSQNPAYKSYATVEVNGKTVAKIDNNGFVETSNSLGKDISGHLPGDVNGQKGPALAQERAEIIADLLGGEVIKSSTAMTQSQFSALPEPQLNVDYKAMMKDPAFEQLQNVKKARTVFVAQVLGESGESQYFNGSVEEYWELASQTPEERFYNFLLKERGITSEADFDALSPAEKVKLESELMGELKEHSDLLSYAIRDVPVVSTGDAAVDKSFQSKDSVVLNTSHGDVPINVDEYFQPQYSPETSIDLMSIPILTPSKENIEALSAHASSKLKTLMEEYGISGAPEEITYDSHGKMSLPSDYEYAELFHQMLEENPSMERELRTINALTSHYVEMQKSVPFVEEMALATSRAERDLIIDKYSYLFSGRKNYSEIALSFSKDGALTPMADGDSYKA